MRGRWSSEHSANQTRLSITSKPLVPFPLIPVPFFVSTEPYLLLANHLVIANVKSKRSEGKYNVTTHQVGLRSSLVYDINSPGES
jgi:hypothetical protein